MKLVQQFLAEDEADLQREIYGIKAKDTPACFDDVKVNALFAAPRHNNNGRIIKYVFVCLDPNSGTHDQNTRTTSDYAAVSAYKISGSDRFAICGIESLDSHGPEDFVKPIVGHIKTLQSREDMRGSTFVIIIENNLGQESAWMRDALFAAGINNMVIMNEKPLKPGVRTSDLVKRDMMQEMRMLLMHDRIVFDEFFVTSHPRPNELFGEFKRQLKAFSCIKKAPKDPSGKVIVNWTGKLATGMKDDAVVAAMLLFYFLPEFLNNTKYSRYWY